MINKYSFKYKLANYFAKLLLKEKTQSYFFSVKQRASCLVKVVFEIDGKILVAKKVKEDSLSRVSIPYGYVDLDRFEDNASACVKMAFDKMNIELDPIDFDKSSLIDLKLDYENDLAQVVYIYKYCLTEQELAKISDSYSLYDFFLLDLNEINEYNKKKRFVTDLDFVILKRLKKG